MGLVVLLSSSSDSKLTIFESAGSLSKTISPIKKVYPLAMSPLLALRLPSLKEKNLLNP